MKVNETLLAWIAIIVLLAFFSPSKPCEAQKKMAPRDYDYYTLAISSISDSTAEASKLPNIPQRVKVYIAAANILRNTKLDETVRLLELTLRDIKEWESVDKLSWAQRNTAATLRNEVLALYALVDPEKAIQRQKEFQPTAVVTSSDSPLAFVKDRSWPTKFNDQRTTADQSARVALSLLKTEPQKALGFVVQSLRGGTISSVLFDIIQELTQSGNRSLLNELENRISQVLSGSVTVDPSSLNYAAILVLADKDMALAAKSSFVSFLIRSLQSWTTLIKEPGIDPSYITNTYRGFSGTIRQVVAQSLPEQLLSYDWLLEQASPLVPESVRLRIQAFQPETFVEPGERLADILKDPNADKRDLRLIRLISELLRTPAEEKKFEFVSEAVSRLSDAEVRSTFTDVLTIARIDALVRNRKFIEAQETASSISSAETRAWALLASSQVAAKADKVLGFELISNALKVLDTAFSGPRKVELALIAAAMFSQHDLQRSFETLSVASRYANSSTSKIDATRSPVAFGVKVTIGDATTKLDVFPQSLGELQIDRSLSTLASVDWFRAVQIVNQIQDSSLRLQLKLQFAGAILARELQQRKKL